MILEHIKSHVNKWKQDFAIKRKSRRKGMTSVEVTIGLLIFLFCFSAAADLVIYFTRMSTMTDIAKELTRTLSVQGGMRDEKPPGYASNYYTASDLQYLVTNNMWAAGFADDDWKVDILTPDGRITLITATSRRTIEIDYLNDFIIEFDAVYDWPLLGFLDRDQAQVHCTMPGLSEWKYDYDNWGSE